MQHLKLIVNTLIDITIIILGILLIVTPESFTTVLPTYCLLYLCYISLSEKMESKKTRANDSSSHNETNNSLLKS